MPLVLTAAPDYPEIRRLIKAHGWTMTRFARMLGRAPKSVYNIKYKDVISTAFICQMATGLGVKPSQISDMEDDPEEAPAGERKMAS